MGFRNPFDRWSTGTPKPKPFLMPNQGTSGNSQFFGGGRAPELTFDIQPTESAQAPEQRPEGSDWTSYLSEMKDIYTKQGPAASAYQEHLSTIPQYETPSKWQRFGAALVGGAEGYQSGAGAGWMAGQTAAQAPYRRAMEDWSVKEKALGRQSEIEDKSSDNRLNYMKEVRAVAKDDREARKWIDEYDLKVTTQKADAKHKEAQERSWEGQGFVKDYDQAGNIIFINPKTKEVQQYGPSSKKTDWAKEDTRNRTGQLNADTARQNKNINFERLGLDQRAGDRADRTADRLENPSISAAEQSSARGSAITRAAQENTLWSSFLDDNGDIDVRKGAQNPTEYDAFRKRIEELEKSIFSRRRTSNLPPRGGGGVIDY